MPASLQSPSDDVAADPGGPEHARAGGASVHLLVEEGSAVGSDAVAAYASLIGLSASAPPPRLSDPSFDELDRAVAALREKSTPDAPGILVLAVPENSWALMAWCGALDRHAGDVEVAYLVGDSRPRVSVHVTDHVPVSFLHPDGLLERVA